MVGGRVCFCHGGFGLGQQFAGEVQVAGQPRRFYQQNEFAPVLADEIVAEDIVALIFLFDIREVQLVILVEQVYEERVGFLLFKFYLPCDPGLYLLQVGQVHV